MLENEEITIDDQSQAVEMETEETAEVEADVEPTPEEQAKQKAQARAAKTKERMAELLRERAEERKERQSATERADRLERELSELRGSTDNKPVHRQRIGGQPDASQYPAGRYDPDYLEALTDWKVEQRFEKQTEKQMAATRNAEINGFEQDLKAIHEDYDESKAAFFEHELADVDAFAEIIKDCDNPAAVMYYLGNNPDEMDKIGNMTPSQAMRYIGKVEVKIETSSQQEPVKKTASSAPRPISPLGGTKSSGINTDPNKMGMDDFAVWDKKPRREKTYS